MQVLDQEQINQKLQSLTEWKLDGDAIKKEWTFQDFSQAMHFINQIATLAETHDHHPEIINVYNRVTLRFNTHSAGGITEKDFSIASDIDRL